MITTKKWKINRSKRTIVQEIYIKDALRKLSEGLKRKLDLKGSYTWESMHEIHGIIAEEVHEALKEMHKNNLDEYSAELIDIAIAAIMGVASIEHLKDKGVYKINEI